MIGWGLLVFAATTPAQSTAAGNSYWTIETLDSSNGWHGETVDGFDGGSASLALDTQDQPRLAYRSGELRYAAKDALGWHSACPEQARANEP
jgi:hypothetical protein